MAENNIAGFKKLMRYAQNLAEYEQGIADGIIDENVFVIVLEEKVAKFKGQTFDWSGGGEDIDISHLATKEELTNLVSEMVANEEVHAAAYNDLNTRLNELSENVQGETVTKEEFNAAIEGVNNDISAKQDVLVSGTNIKTINNESILGSGNIEINVDTSSLASKEELQNLQNEVIANEEVVATAFNDLDSRFKDIGSLISGVAVTKEELQEGLQAITDEIVANEEVTAAALNELNERIENADSIAYPEINHGTGDTTFTLTPNTFHVWDEVSALTLTLGSKTSGIVNEFLFQFTSGTTATNLTLPTGLAYFNGDVPTIEANSTYQVSIVNGLCVIAKFA